MNVVVFVIIVLEPKLGKNWYFFLPFLLDFIYGGDFL